MQRRKESKKPEICLFALHHLVAFNGYLGVKSPINCRSTEIIQHTRRVKFANSFPLSGARAASTRKYIRHLEDQ